MRKYTHCVAFILALSILANDATADNPAEQVAKIAGCDGLTDDDLKKCLASAGVSAGVGQALGIPGFNPSAMFSNARNQAQNVATNARSFFGGIAKSASKFVYSSLGKGDLHAMAEEGGQFLGALSWWIWAHNANNPFPECIKIAQTMPEDIRAAVQKWRNALMDEGIPPTKQTNIDALANMGYTIVQNTNNVTIITNAAKDTCWLKSPWGWLTCSKDKTIILNQGANIGKVVPIDQINEAIASGELVPMIWNKEASTMENFSTDNCYRLVENNLGGFISLTTQNG